MTRRALRAARPKTVPFADIEQHVGFSKTWFAGFAGFGAEMPKTARVWRGKKGVTIQIAGRSSDGLRITSTVKLGYA